MEGLLVFLFVFLLGIRYGLDVDYLVFIDGQI